jgi:hypothetical protein
LKYGGEKKVDLVGESSRTSTYSTGWAYLAPTTSSHHFERQGIVPECSFSYKQITQRRMSWSIMSMRGCYLSAEGAMNAANGNIARLIEERGGESDSQVRKRFPETGRNSCTWESESQILCRELPHLQIASVIYPEKHRPATFWFLQPPSAFS